MRNSRKNSIIRGITAVLAVLLMAAFMLAGCADKDAQAAADAAMQAAKDAQAAADAANKLAQDAQNKADTNAGTIATLPTEDKVAAAIKALIADYAKGTVEGADDLVTSTELTAFLSSDELAAVLADYALDTDVDALKTKLNEYVTIAALETDYAKKAAVTGEITAAISALKTELLGKIEACVADVATKATKAELKVVADDLDIAEGKLTTAITNLATAQNDIADLKKALADYEAATPEIVDMILDIQEAVNALDSNDYSEAYFEVLFEDAQVAMYTLLRATSIAAATEIYDAIIEELESTHTITEQLAALLDEYTNSNDNDKLILTTDEAEVKACEDLVKEAEANNVALDNYGETKRDLKAETESFRAFLTWINNNPATAVNAAIQNVIATKYAEIICTETAKVDDLDAKIQAVGMDTWLGYFAEATIKDYAENQGIENAAKSVEKAIDDLLKDENKYKDAVDTLARLRKEQQAAADLVTEIDYLLTKSLFKKFNTALYTYHGEAVTLNTKVVDWATAAKVATADITILVTNYADLGKLIAYTTEMNKLYEEAKKIAADVKAAADLYKDDWNVVIADREVVENAIDKYIDWARTPTDTGVYVDMDNRAAMFDSLDVMYLMSAHDAMMKLVADEINADIADLLARKDDFTIMTMNDEIRPLRDAIVEWMNRYEVRATGDVNTSKTANWIVNANTAKGDIPYVDVDTLKPADAYPIFNTTYGAFSGYDMINTADFDAVIDAYDAHVEGIITGAEKFLKAVDNIDETTKILYQALNIEAAETEYIKWTTAYDLQSINFEKLDMGETFANQATAIVNAYLKLVASKTDLDKTVAEAQASFIAFEKKLDAANAIKTVTIKSNAIPAVKEAFNAWLNTYLTKDATTGAYIFDAAIASITGIMTSSDYSTYVAKEVEYEAVVADAIKAGKKIAADLEKAGLDGNNIKALENAIKAWLGNTNYATLAQLKATENNVVDPRLLDDKTGINMIALDEAIKALRADYDAKMKAISDAVNAIPENITADNADDYKAKVDAALAAVDAFIKANGGKNESSDVTLAQINAIYTAKVNVATYDAIAAVNADEALTAEKKAAIIAAYNSAAEIEIASIGTFEDGTEKDTDFSSYTDALALLENNFEMIYEDHTK